MNGQNEPILDFKQIPKPSEDALCCSGMSGAIDRGWVIPKGADGRVFFTIPVRNKQKTNIILNRCFQCGQEVYP